MDRIERRAGIASLVLHGVLALIAFAPALATIALRRDQDSSKPPPPPAQQRLVLAPTLAPAPPPLPKLTTAQLPGWAEAGTAPLPTEVVAPRATDHDAVARSRGESGENEAPVRLPRQDASIDRAASFAGKTWSEQELTAEQDRLATAANFLEFRLRGEYRRSWTALRTPTAKPVVYLQLRVDARGIVVEGRRLSSTGSTALDEAVDRWLRDQGSPVSLPSIAPGVPHTFKVSLW
jgi:hypothetical protein